MTAPSFLSYGPEGKGVLGDQSRQSAGEFERSHVRHVRHVRQCPPKCARKVVKPMSAMSAKVRQSAGEFERSHVVNVVQVVLNAVFGAFLSKFAAKAGLAGLGGDWAKSLPRALLTFPVGAAHGTIRLKPKGPALQNVFGQAVATPTDKRGFVTPKFSGLVRLHRSRMVYGHGGGYPQGRPHGLSRVLNRHAHPLRVKTQPVVLKSRQGATMPHTTTSANVRITTPTTGTTTTEAQAFALLQATSDATMAKLYLSRGNIHAARRKAVQLLKALQAMEVAA